MQTFFAQTVFLLSLPALLPAQNQAPVLSNVSASANWQAQTLTLSYDVIDADNDPLDISIAVSNTGGDTYLLTGLAPATGDIGFPVTPGAGKTITCDLSQLPSGNGPFTVRIVADDNQPFDIQALVNEVDSNRLRDDLTFVQGIRHFLTGPAHLAAVQDSLRHCFADAGLFVGEQSFPYSTYTGRNIYGTLRGTESAQQVVIVDAHYDSVANAPGADDNGSGTVGVMEIARLLGRYPTEKTVRFIGFDLEEFGTVGSLRYVQTGIPAGESILGVLNFEMIGYYSEEPNSQELPTGFNLLFPAASAQVAANDYKGDFLINVGNVESMSLGTAFANASAQYVPELKVLSLYPPGNSEIAPDLRRSDHARFWDAGYQALMLTDGANFRNEHYHTPQDSLTKLHFGFMANVVKATLATAAQLAGVRHGDYATVSFEGTVATQDFDGRCDFVATADRSGNLFLQVDDCGLRQAFLEIFDLKGSLLSQQNVVLDAAGSQSQIISLQAVLPVSGMYLVKITTPEGTFSQKIIRP